VFADGVLRQELVKHGAPVDFYAHAMRHTVATWLQSKGHSEWEIGLVLNHAGSGVTAGYSHSYPLDRKRELLGKWSDHVERLVRGGEGLSTPFEACIRASADGSKATRHFPSVRRKCRARFENNEMPYSRSDLTRMHG
jgi:hypothetical protein